MPVGGLIGTPGFDVARERGGYGIWVDTDGYVSLPGVQDVILTSVMKKMDNSCYAVIQETMEGKFKGCSDLHRRPGRTAAWVLPRTTTWTALFRLS